VETIITQTVAVHVCMAARSETMCEGVGWTPAHL